MDSSACFEALLGRGSRNKTDDSNSLRDMSLLQVVASQFAEQASKLLTSEQYEELIAFLDRPTTPILNDAATMMALQDEIDRKLRDFYTREMAVSGEDDRRLGQPDGNIAAELGLILHLETRDIAYGQFFANDNPTMELLVAKGIDPKSTFGMDWHWRGETTKEYSSRRSCPYDSRKELREIHDQFSLSLLRIVPMPFVVVGSRCVQRTLKKHLCAAVTVEVDSLEFMLDYHPDGLRRIFLNLPHPTAGFRADPDTKARLALQLDLGWDFMLWLTGQNYIPKVFWEAYDNKDAKYSHCASMIATWNYRKRERDMQRHLGLDELPLSYTHWAKAYLDSDLVSILNNGGSIVDAIITKTRGLQSDALVTRRVEERKLKRKVDGMPSQITSIQGIAVHLLSRGDVTIRKLSPEPPLRLRMYAKKSAELVKLKQALCVRLTKDDFQLPMADKVVYSRPLKDLPPGEDWKNQVEYELRLLGEPTVQFTSTKTKKEQRPTLWINQLLEGGSRAIDNEGRMNFAYMKVPLSGATRKTAFLQADLVTTGIDHPHRACADTPFGDPGRRIGLKVKYDTAQGVVEKWLELIGASQLAKLNSLVDVLEGQPRTWTALQPRRYLHDHGGQRHYYSDEHI